MKNLKWLCFANTTLNYGETLSKCFAIVYFIEFVEEKANLLIAF